MAVLISLGTLAEFLARFSAAFRGEFSFYNNSRAIIFMALFHKSSFFWRIHFPSNLRATKIIKKFADGKVFFFDRIFDWK